MIDITMVTGCVNTVIPIIIIIIIIIIYIYIIIMHDSFPPSSDLWPPME